MHKLADFLAQSGMMAAWLTTGGVRQRGAAACRALRDTLGLYLGLGLLAAICLAWAPCALLLDRALTPPRAGRIGRYAACAGFRVYVRLLTAMGGGRFDLTALDSLRDAPALIIAPNHPSLLDAVLIVSRLPNVACVMKAALMQNLFLGAGARLAGYIGNASLRRMIAGSVATLAAGNHLLLFPEGTRTAQKPVSPFQRGIGLIARRSGASVQTVFIETDSLFLSKGWPLFRRAALPIRYRVRLGRRFAPGGGDLEAELEAYFRAELTRHPPLPSDTPS